jgi:transcriptional regulator with PAS, ATPase and Fis domain
MKKIQREWKEIGHVPRKHSDAIWKEFKTACNHYFDRLHSSKNSAFEKEKKNFELKMTVLDELRAFQLTGNREKDLKTIQGYLGKWQAIGHVPRNKKHVMSKFQKILDALFRKMNVGKQEAEILMYGDRIADLAKEDDSRAIEQERQFIRKKIEDVKGEIRQLENNLNFFSEPSEENPLVKEVLANLDKKKKGLDNWKSKMKKLNIMRNSLKSEAENAQVSEEEPDENAG